MITKTNFPHEKQSADILRHNTDINLCRIYEAFVSVTVRFYIMQQLPASSQEGSGLHQKDRKIRTSQGSCLLQHCETLGHV
jgi:hypothetical protein